MVSFSCEGCGDVLTKKKLDSHRSQCYGATFTCIDCMTHFPGTSYRPHTSCISEAQKYQGHLYREKDNKKSKADRRKSNGNTQEMIPRGAYVEDAPEGDESNAVAIVDVPPRAPTPPPASEALPENVNVFDFLVTEDDPTGAATKPIEASQDRLMIDRPPSQINGYDGHYEQYGFEYGHAPLQPAYERYDSWVDLNDSQRMGFVTPGPRPERDGKRSEKSEKKRKRQQIDELDLSSAKRPMSRDSMIVDPPTADRRVLHSGLTGGLSKLVTDQEFYSDRIDAGPTPISPLKRHRGESIDERLRKDTNRKSSHTSSSKASSSRPAAPPEDNNRHRPSRHRRHDSSSSEDGHTDPRHRSSTRKAIEYRPTTRPGSVQPTAKNQLITYHSRAELFLSFINKGPDSERGCSINKALKRYHRERGEREEDDKELWKSLRVKRNDRGEIVLFI